ncbi:hypothetical protein HPB51_017975 [Rhipicephalus microplus]|uniref:Uncharacterized protein n=1 Tax=Rhipicephalus microplus TaxID=6941 RepID=A0A9J6D6K0_RHIMP|nr:hypothetical protein HPB51_017975 [Rhipicephalus microplus]
MSQAIGGCRTRHPEDVVVSAVGDLDEDAGCLKASGMGIIDSSFPRAACAPVFNVASPSIADFPGNHFPPWPRLRSPDRPDSTSEVAYLPELDRWADIKYEETPTLCGYISALLKLKRARLQLFSQPACRPYIGVKENITMPEPRTGHSNYSNAEQYARKRDPSIMKLAQGKGPHGVRHTPVVTASGTVCRIRPPTALITGDHAVPEDVIGVKQLRLPWRPQ